MTLAEYLDKHKLSDADFAEQLGAHRTEVWNYRTGRRKPSADRIVAIETLTRGHVKARDFVSADS